MAENHYNRAQLYELQFDIPNALRHYAKAFQYRPDNVEYGIKYTDILTSNTDYVEARTVFTRTIQALREWYKQDPDRCRPCFAQVLHKLGRVYIMLGKYDEAIQSLNEAHTMFMEVPAYPAAGWTLVNLGNAYERKRELSLAVEKYKEAETLGRTLPDPDLLAQALMSMSSLYEDEGKHQKAKSLDEEVLPILEDTAKVARQYLEFSKANWMKDSFSISTCTTCPRGKGKLFEAIDY